jgi:hypothetical protein
VCGRDIKHELAGADLRCRANQKGQTRGRREGRRAPAPLFLDLMRGSECFAGVSFNGAEPASRREGPGGERVGAKALPCSSRADSDNASRCGGIALPHSRPRQCEATAADTTRTGFAPTYLQDRQAKILPNFSASRSTNPRKRWPRRSAASATFRTASTQSSSTFARRSNRIAKSMWPIRSWLFR